MNETDVHGQPRFAMLETIREYAGDRLTASGDAKRVRERHRDYFLALAKAAEPKLTGAEQAEWLQRLEAEHENLRASFDWSLVSTGAQGGLRLCGALERFWLTRGHLSEGREWCVRVLGKAEVEKRTLERAKALNTAGVLAYYQGDYLAARALHEESLEIKRDFGDRWGIAGSLNNLGNVAYEQGDYPVARALHEESLAIKRGLGDRWGIGASLNNLGTVAYEQRDYPAARALFEESLAIRRELGDRVGIASSLSNLGEVACEQGDYPAAGALHQEGLVIRREVGDRRGITYSLEGLAAVVAALGSSLRAARIWGAAERLGEEIGSPLAPNELPRYNRRVAAARAALGDDAAFDRAWQEGRALMLEQAIELALEETVERR